MIEKMKKSLNEEQKNLNVLIPFITFFNKTAVFLGKIPRSILIKPISDVNRLVNKKAGLIALQFEHFYITLNVGIDSERKVFWVSLSDTFNITDDNGVFKLDVINDKFLGALELGFLNHLVNNEKNYLVLLPDINGTFLSLDTPMDWSLEMKNDLPEKITITTKISDRNKLYNLHEYIYKKIMAIQDTILAKTYDEVNGYMYPNEKTKANPFKRVTDIDKFNGFSFKVSWYSKIKLVSSTFNAKLYYKYVSGPVKTNEFKDYKKFLKALFECLFKEANREFFNCSHYFLLSNLKVRDGIEVKHAIDLIRSEALNIIEHIDHDPLAVIQGLEADDNYGYPLLTYCSDVNNFGQKPITVKELSQYVSKETKRKIGDLDVIVRNMLYRNYIDREEFIEEDMVVYKSPRPLFSVIALMLVTADKIPDINNSFEKEKAIDVLKDMLKTIPKLLKRLEPSLVKLLIKITNDLTLKEDIFNSFIEFIATKEFKGAFVGNLLKTLNDLENHAVKKPNDRVREKLLNETKDLEKKSEILPTNTHLQERGNPAFPGKNTVNIIRGNPWRGGRIEDMNLRDDNR